MASNEKTELIKVGFKITEIMSKDIEKLYREVGYNNKADFIRQAIRKETERLGKESDQGIDLKITQHGKVGMI